MRGTHEAQRLALQFLVGVKGKGKRKRKRKPNITSKRAGRH